jgi:hypothetical protein
MALVTTEIKTNQNLFDLATSLYGNVAYVFQLISDNPSITFLEDAVSAGDSVVYETVITSTTPVVEDIPVEEVKQKSTLVRDSQNLFDLSLQLYGDVEKVFQILQDNPGFGSLDNGSLTGREVFYTEQGQTLTDHLKINELFIVTGFGDESRQFDDSFSFSFL